MAGAILCFTDIFDIVNNFFIFIIWKKSNAEKSTHPEFHSIYKYMPKGWLKHFILASLASLDFFLYQEEFESSWLRNWKHDISLYQQLFCHLVDMYGLAHNYSEGSGSDQASSPTEKEQGEPQGGEEPVLQLPEGVGRAGQLGREGPYALLKFPTSKTHNGVWPNLP